MIATYKCKECEKIFNSKIAKDIKCPDCEGEATRQFKSVEVGDIVSDEILSATNTMLYGSLPSGKDRVIF